MKHFGQKLLRLCFWRNVHYVIIFEVSAICPGMPKRSTIGFRSANQQQNHLADPVLGWKHYVASKKHRSHSARGWDLHWHEILDRSEDLESHGHIEKTTGSLAQFTFLQNALRHWSNTLHSPKCFLCLLGEIYPNLSPGISQPKKNARRKSNRTAAGP